MPNVSELVKGAKLVAYDGCHKIYLAMDQDQAKWFKKHYVKETDKVVAGTASEMLGALEEWWQSACPFRFITAVYTKENEDDFVEVIAQGDEWDA